MLNSTPIPNFVSAGGAKLSIALRSIALFSVILSATEFVDSAEPEQRPSARKTSLLVMTNGRVEEGIISQSAGGYVVEKPKGRMLVPFNSVQMEATDLNDAYRKWKKVLADPTASKHLQLARWCMSHQLYEEAREELRGALELEPERREARTMLVRLEQVMNPPKPVHRPQAKKQRTVAGFEAPPVESLEGLSQVSVRQFVKKVQPILLSRCGNARCHAMKTDREFRLIHVHGGRRSHKRFAERNLAAALKLIDADNPRASRLLTATRGIHANGRLPLFRGRNGIKQRLLLEEWVQSVIGKPNKPKKAYRPGAQFGPEAIVKRPRKSGQFPRRARTPQPAATKSAASKGDKDLLDTILLEEQEDAFDPGAFNRAAHGGRPRRRPSAAPAAN